MVRTSIARESNLGSSLALEPASQKSLERSQDRTHVSERLGPRLEDHPSRERLPITERLGPVNGTMAEVDTQRNYPVNEETGRVPITARLGPVILQEGVEIASPVELPLAVKRKPGRPPGSGRLPLSLSRVQLQFHTKEEDHRISPPHWEKQDCY